MTRRTLPTPLAQALADPEVRAFLDARADMADEPEPDPDFVLWLEIEEEARGGPLTAEERERAERFWDAI